jgi:tetratricopeptide (TPR) repeat protein
LHFGVLAPLALLGLWSTWTKRARLQPLYWMLSAYTASLLIFYVFGRYRLPMVPFLALFAGAGISGLPEFLRTNGAARVAAAAASVAAFAVFCNWRVVDVDYMRSVTHYNMGNEFVAREEFDAAAAQYRRAIDLFAGNALATHNLGVMLAGQGDLAAARAQYERALILRPGYAEAHFNLARTLAETGDPEGAAVQFESGLARERGRAEIYHELGRVYLDLGAASLARACFLRTLRFDPDHTEARRDLLRSAATDADADANRSAVASACRATD